MSYITNVLIYGASEKDVEALNEWIKANDQERKQFLGRINMDAAGGTKFFTDDVWAAAFNYAPSGLRGKLRDPSTWGNGLLSVMVFVDGEDDQEVTIFGFAGQAKIGRTLRQVDYDLSGLIDTPAR